MVNNNQHLEELIEIIKIANNGPEHPGILKRNGHKWNRGLPSLDYYDNRRDQFFDCVRFNKYYK